MVNKHEILDDENSVFSFSRRNIKDTKQSRKVWSDSVSYNVISTSIIWILEITAFEKKENKYYMKWRCLRKELYEVVEIFFLKPQLQGHSHTKFRFFNRDIWTEKNHIIGAALKN